MPARGSIGTVNALQKRGFSGTAGTCDSYQLPGAKRKINPGKTGYFCTCTDMHDELFGKTFNLQHKSNLRFLRKAAAQAAETTSSKNQAAF
jgi:hypothetical protein